MNFRRHLRNTESPLVQSTAWLNVALLLLGLFVGGLALVPPPREAGVWLSVPGNAPADMSSPDGMVIEIAASGELSVNRQALTSEELRVRLIRFSRETVESVVLVRADTRASLAHVLGVIDACRNAAIDQYRVSALPSER